MSELRSNEDVVARVEAMIGPGPFVPYSIYGVMLELAAEVTRLRTELAAEKERADELSAAVNEGIRQIAAVGKAGAESIAAARAEVSQLRAKIERVETLTNKWCAASDLTTGKASLVAWAFAAELRAALAEPSGTPVSDKPATT